MAKAIHTILQLKDKFSSTIRRINGNTRETQRQVKALNNRVEKFRSSAVKTFTTAAAKAGTLAAGMAGVAGAAAAIGGSVSFIKDYKKAMDDLQIQTGATGAELSGLKDTAKALYAENIGESFESVSSALALAKQMTNQTGEALKETTRQAVIFRDAFGVEEAESIKVVDTMMKQFGISSKEAYNLLAQGQQKGLNKSGDMMDVINEYSNQFKAAGYSASEMFDVLAAGAKGGAFSIDKVGDAIKEANIRLKDGSKTSAAGFEAIGLNAKEMTKEYAKGGESAKKAMAKVFKALESIKDPAEQNAAAVALFGTQFEDLESQVIFSMGNVEKTFDATKDTMESIKDVKYDNVGAAFRGIKRDLEVGLLIPLGDYLLPKLNEFAQWVKSQMPQIKNEFVYAFKLAGKAIDGFKTAIGWAKDNASWLIPVITGLTGAIIAQKVVSEVTKMYKKWTAVTEGLTFAQKALSIVTGATPFGWIALAIGVVIAAGVALWQNWDTVKKKASDLWAWLSSTWDSLKNGTIGMLQGIGDWFSNTFNSIRDGVKSRVNDMIDMINGLISKVNQFTKIKTPEWMGGKEIGFEIPTIKGYATGTSYFSGGIARTDEHGDEIKELPNGTKIIPHSLSKRMTEGTGGGVTVNLTVQGNVIGNEDFANQLGGFIVKRLQLATGNM